MRVVAGWGRGVGLMLVAGSIVAACAAPAPRATPAGNPSGAGSGQAATPPPASVRSAFVSIAANVLPVWLAVDRGIYEKYGLSVELTYIAGLAKIAETLLAGEIDIGVTPAPSAMGPGLQGADLVMIASWSNQSAFSLYAHPSVTSVQDLRGKRIATSRRGSLSELWAAEVLQRYGLTAERDYAVLPMGGQPEQLAGLQNGAVDASVVGVPTNLIARKLGYRELLSYKDEGLEFANMGAVVSRKLLREQPSVAERFLKATAEGIAMMMLDAEASLAVLGDRTKLEERDMLEESLAFERLRTARDMIPSAEGLQAAMDSLVASNEVATGGDPMKFVDLSIVRKLTDDGFIASLYR